MKRRKRSRKIPKDPFGRSPIGNIPSTHDDDAFDRKIRDSFPIPEDQWGSDEDDKEQYETHEGVDEDDLCVIYADELNDSDPPGMFLTDIDEATNCTNDGLREWIGFIKEENWEVSDDPEDEYYTVPSCNYHKNKINADYNVAKWEKNAPNKLV